MNAVGVTGRRRENGFDHQAPTCTYRTGLATLGTNGQAIKIDERCSCRQHLSAKGTSAVCSGRSSGFRIVPNLLLPIRNALLLLTTGIDASTVDYCRLSPRLQRRDRDGILTTTHQSPSSLFTRTHVSASVSDACQHVRAPKQCQKHGHASTKCTLITHNLNATPVRHVDSLSRNRRIYPSTTSLTASLSFRNTTEHSWTKRFARQKY